MEDIRIEDALPVVFEHDRVRASEVWRSRLKIRRGERIVISAESGTGKSSLCAYLYGNRKDYLGKILFNGDDIRNFSIGEWQELRRRHLSYLPQELSLFPELTAMQNIELKNSLTGHVGRDRIEEWLQMLGIEARADFPVGKMSVGQQQRVGIIRALCQPFDFILLDEPVSHLDENNNRIAARLIAEEAERQGAGIIATSVGNHLLLEDAVTICL
ncbi:MAG: ATP-binding cassette domain-containing protein [Muribaculaceae bacterium]|nr:ATP-binding cassette domain-containing protein [Muribaculaceae bacterium]